MKNIYKKFSLFYLQFIAFTWIVVLYQYPSDAFAQGTKQSVWKTISSDAEIALWKDVGSYFSQPYYITTNSALITGGVLGTTFIGSYADEGFRDYFQRNQSEAGNTIANVLRQVGEVRTAAALPSLVYIYGLAAGNDDVRITGRMMFQSILYSGIVTTLAKSIIGRSRPFLNSGNTEFHPFTTQDQFSSLPSGHTTVAFALASVLSERIKNTPTSVLLYTIAAGTGISRIYNDRHWFSDVLLGAAIGTVTGLAVSSFEKSRETQSSSELFRNVSVGIVPYQNTTILSIQMSL